MDSDLNPCSWCDGVGRIYDDWPDDSARCFTCTDCGGTGHLSPTGRRTSRPALQNIPIRTEEGKHIRDAFRRGRR